MVTGFSDWLIRVVYEKPQAMIAFCTRCWAEIDDRVDLCPFCDADQTSDPRTYDEKIVAALQHPLPQARARICWLIGENKIRAAVPNLLEIAERDPDIYVQKAAVEALGSIGDSRSKALLRKLSESNNRFLAAAASQSLRTAAPD